MRTLIKWNGDNPKREGLIETPKRVVKAFEEYFTGYYQDPKKILEKTFSETSNYKEFVMLKDIDFRSHCEHHLAPIIGSVHVAYVPQGRVIGISTIARLVNAFSRRLQVQEKMTSKIANTLQSA